MTKEQRKQLVADNINFVYWLAKENKIYDKDVIQQGMIAMIKSSHTFDPTHRTKGGKTVKFVTYAKRGIVLELKKAQARQWYGKGAKSNDKRTKNKTKDKESKPATGD